MKNGTLIISLLICLAATAQVGFKTIVPPQPVIVGESFRVQYVAAGVQTMDHIIPPSFRGFRLVNEPEVYNRNQATNTIYTLLALETGRFKIPGAITVINGKNYRSNDAWVDVISKEQAELHRRENGAIAGNSEYYLSPGEDPYKKIRENLFVKVVLNKKTCYSGEPVVATFKLYSRLQSKSEITKNPGFYGFTVHDIANISDKRMVIETVNGKPFDVHTVRQVQLYPLQAGEFTIDPMEINNRVEFSRTVMNKVTEQVITEGGEMEEAATPGAEVFENTIRTEPVVISVKPTPPRNKPGDYNGATGNFSLEVTVEKSQLARNEEGVLIVTIKGKGNFSQLLPPAIEWPGGIEGFDPVVNEVVERTISPLQGYKTFRFPFISSKPGSYRLPAVKFSFFNPDSNNYRTLSSSPKNIIISNEEKSTPSLAPVTHKRSFAEVNRKASMIAAAIVVAFVLVVVVYWVSKKRGSGKEENTTINDKTNIEEQGDAPTTSIEERLKQVRLLEGSPDREFYSSLYHTLWGYLSEVFELSGTNINKQVLGSKLRERGFDREKELLEVIQLCETGMFTNATLDNDREELLQQVQQFMEQVAG